MAICDAAPPRQHSPTLRHSALLRYDSCSFWAENFGRSLEGQGRPTRGSRVSIQSFKWKPATCANSATARNTSSNHLRLQKANGPSFSNKQSSHQTKRNNLQVFFSPSNAGSRQVVYQAGKTIAFCKFTELMQWQHQS